MAEKPEVESHSDNVTPSITSNVVAPPDDVNSNAAMSPEDEDVDDDRFPDGIEETDPSSSGEVAF